MWGFLPFPMAELGLMHGSPRRGECRCFTSWRALVGEENNAHPPPQLVLLGFLGALSQSRGTLQAGPELQLRGSPAAWRVFWSGWLACGAAEGKASAIPETYSQVCCRGSIKLLLGASVLPETVSSGESDTWAGIVPSGRPIPRYCGNKLGS